MEGKRSGGDTTAPQSSVAAAAPARIQLLHVVQAPEGAVAQGSARVPIESTELVIGREPQGPRTLALADGRVSRSHAAVRRDAAGEGLITDCGSKHGTFVDGVRVEQARLVHGSVVRLGDTLLVVSDTRLTVEQAKTLAPETPALLGASLAMQRVRGEIALVAPRVLSALVLGETGVGKERVAEELHRQSGRAGPLLAINCAAVTPSLAESELFGHAAGAFTGAVHKHDGLFVAADRGTLFLDEVAELPAALQPKLLRALATGEVRAVGRSDGRKVDVRVVAATHGDLQGAVDAGSFRGDLFARLAGWVIVVPPLRDRREDVVRLASAFIARHAPATKLSANAAEALLLHAWPFNVRELEQVVTAALVRATESTLRHEHLPEPIARPITARAPIGASDPPPAPLRVRVPADVVPDADGLRMVLEELGGNVARVASYFGKDRKQIYRWAERLGVKIEDGRPAGS
jgi:transcriptional regulator with GAF, ATPase, and Fis domain